MKKVRLVCIVLGVLILAGIACSGTMARISEEPVKDIQSITFEEFLKSPESFVGKEVELTEGIVAEWAIDLCTHDRGNLVITFNRKWLIEDVKSEEICAVYLTPSAIKNKERVEIGDVVTVKGEVGIITKGDTEKFNELIVKELDESTWGYILSNSEKVYYILASEIRVTDDLRAHDRRNLVIIPNKKFLIEEAIGLSAVQTIEEPVQEETITIPDYENFPYKQHFTVDRDKDGEDELVIESYIGKIEIKDLTDKLVSTTKDIITIIKVPSSKVVLLTWIPEISVDIDKATNMPDLKSIDPDHIRSITRYAVKEGGQWKFVDEKTYAAKAEELMKSVGFTDEEIEELEKKSK